MSHAQYWQQVGQWEEQEKQPRAAARRYAKTRRGQDMKVSEMMPSKYIKQDDVDGEVLVTVQGLKKVNVAQQDEEPDYKWTIKWHEFEKPMVLNSTNLKRMAKALGDDTDGWTGNSVILYVDENVEFGGNVVGGLRIKAAKNISGPAKTAAKFDERDPPPF